MAKLWPSRSSTLVLARRTLRPGMATLPVVRRMELAASISLTSGSILRLMRPSSSTMGVKLSLTPNSLNWMVTLPSSCPIGMGNSPPARKLAFSPESAVRLGSARRRASFFCSSAVIRTSGLAPLPRILATRVPNGSEPDKAPRPMPGARIPMPEPVPAPIVLPADCPVDAEILARRAVHFDEADFEVHLLVGGDRHRIGDRRRRRNPWRSAWPFRRRERSAPGLRAAPGH